MKIYYAAIILPLKEAVVWGVGNCEGGARKDASHWINDNWVTNDGRLANEEIQAREKKKLKIIPITERVKQFINDEGGYNVKLRRLKNGIYDLNKK